MVQPFTLHVLGCHTQDELVLKVFIVSTTIIYFSASGRLSGGVLVRAQHPRHEGPTYNSGHASQPVGSVRALHRL